MPPLVFLIIFAASVCAIGDLPLNADNSLERKSQSVLRRGSGSLADSPGTLLRHPVPGFKRKELTRTHTLPAGGDVLELFSAQPRRSLRLCGEYCWKAHRRDAEDAEIAQRFETRTSPPAGALTSLRS